MGNNEGATAKGRTVDSRVVESLSVAWMRALRGTGREGDHERRALDRFRNHHYTFFPLTARSDARLSPPPASRCSRFTPGRSLPGSAIPTAAAIQRGRRRRGDGAGVHPSPCSTSEVRPHAVSAAPVACNPTPALLPASRSKPHLGPHARAPAHTDDSPEPRPPPCTLSCLFARSLSVLAELWLKEMVVG